MDEMKSAEFKARHRICDAVLLLEAVEEEELPEKFQDEFVKIYNDLYDLLDEIDKELFPEEEGEKDE